MRQETLHSAPIALALCRPFPAALAQASNGQNVLVTVVNAQLQPPQPVAAAVCLALRPPPPWDFHGEVTDSKTSMGIAGVEVDLMVNIRPEVKTFTTFTDANGRYDLQVPAPRPAYIHVRYRKDNYEAEEPLKIPSDKPRDQPMIKLRR